MSEYESVKKGRLLLKGEKPSLKRKKKHKDKEKKEKHEPVEDLDKIVHGGWSKVKNIGEMVGGVAIEFGEKGSYISALDDGLFTLGPPHDDGEGPSPEEVLTCIGVDDRRVAFKSGYGKYVGVAKDGIVTARADAIGPLEHWEPIFQEHKMALLSSNGGFMGVRLSDDTVVAVKKSAGEDEMVCLRVSPSSGPPPPPHTHLPPPEDAPSASLKDIELDYVKKFQKFQDKKIKLNQDSRREVKKARQAGNLHEVLLNRRSKMKADRYCKI